MTGTVLRQQLRLMVITDERASRGRTTEEVVRQALRGGATSIQVRDKKRSDAGVLALAQTICGLAQRSDALVVVNDRMDVARLAGAGGCHLGEDDLPLVEARRQWPGAILGFSADSPAAALRAAAAGADYLGVGPVFSTTNKGDAGAPLGLEGLARVAAATALPVVAIGGISIATAGDCIDAGACGVAVIAAVAGAAAVAPAARQLRRAVDAGLAAR